MTIIARVLRVVEKSSDVTASNYNSRDDTAGCSNKTSDSKLDEMPYRLTEQFVIKVNKDTEPKVCFYLYLFVDLLLEDSLQDNSVSRYFCD